MPRCESSNVNHLVALKPRLNVGAVSQFGTAVLFRVTADYLSIYDNARYVHVSVVVTISGISRSVLRISSVHA